MFVPLSLMDATENRSVVQPGRIWLNRPGHWGIWILSVWSWVLIWPGLLIAAGPPAEDATTHRPVAQPVAPAEQSTVTTAKIAKPPPTREQKRKVVVVTSIVIAGILTILLCLLMWIVWWSRRTHRLLRAPLPAANRGDELWYLKAKRPPNPANDSPPAPPQA